MNISVSVLSLVIVLTLTLFLSFLTFSYWRVQREDRNPLWLTAWLAVSALFALCRILQYAPLSETMYTVVPRILLTAGFSLVWLGYEFANAFSGFSPPRRERALYILFASVPILLIWTSNLILTDELVARETLIGGEFQGVATGIFYLPVSLLILGLAFPPLIRLLRAPSKHKREDRWLAAGYVFIILFSLNDFFATALNLTWVRLSDFSYLPIAILFCYIQVNRFGVLYRNMNVMVDERTAELSRVNQALLAGISEREQASASLRESEEKYRTVVENASDGITILRDGRVVYVNRRLSEMRGEAVSKLIGQPFDRYVHPDEKNKVLERYRRRLAGQEEPTTYETVLLGKDDSEISVEITTGPISYQGTTAEMVIIRDISERKQGEQALQRQLWEMSVLNAVATAGSEATSIDELIECVTAAVGEILYPDNFGVLLADEDLNTWKPHPSYQGLNPGQEEGVYSLSKDVVRKAVVSGSILGTNGSRHNAISMEAAPGNQSKIAVPILVNGKIFGCLNAESKDVDAFTEQDERLLSTIAESMSTSIEKILLLQTEKQRREEAEVLYNTTRDLVVQRDLSEMLQVIVERAAEMLGASGGGLYLCDTERQQVRCVVSYHLSPDYCGTTLKYGEGAAGIIAETGDPLVIEDYRTWNGSAAAYEEEQLFTSMIGVPLLWQERVIGVLHVLENKVRKFTPENLRTVTLFANQAAIAIENARLLEVERRQRQESMALAEVGRDMSSSLQLSTVLERINAHSKQLLNVETSAVYLSDPASPELWAIAALGPDADEILQDPLTIGEGILGNIYLQKTGEIVNYTGWDPRAITIKGTVDVPAEHLMGVPILTKGELTGLIAVWRTGVGQEFQTSELNFLTSLAQQAAIAIDNARLFEETQRRLRELEGIANAGAALSRTLELEPLLETILQSTIHAIHPAERGSILLADEDQTLHIQAVWGYQDARVREQIFPPGSGYSTLAFHHRRGIIVPDVLAAERIRYNGDIPEMLSGGSAIAAPLILKDRAIGVIAIDTTTQLEAFDKGHLHLLESLAPSAALAIENARLFEDTRRRLAELEIIQIIASALRAAQVLDEVFPIILDQLINLLGFGGALVDLVDQDTGEIVTRLAQGAWASMTGSHTAANVGGSGRVIVSGEPYVTADVIADGVIALPHLNNGLNATACVPIVAQQKPIGTIWVGRRGRTSISDEEVKLLTAIGEMVGNTIQRMKLHEQTVAQAEEIARAYDLTLEGWAKALEFRDKETEGHSRRVTTLTLQLAQQFGISAPDLVHIHRGVLLHDIGKMGVPDRILNKTGPLSEDEWCEMKKHPQIAYDLIHPIAYLRPALDIPYCHHEKWDGSGYPHGLRGEQIPLTARLFAVVDVYDALSNDRPYRRGWPKPEVLAYLRVQSGKHFDPQVVDAFLSMLDNELLINASESKYVLVTDRV